MNGDSESKVVEWKVPVLGQWCWWRSSGWMPLCLPGYHGKHWCLPLGIRPELDFDAEFAGHSADPEFWYSRFGKWYRHPETGELLVWACPRRGEKFYQPKISPLQPWLIQDSYSLAAAIDFPNPYASDEFLQGFRWVVVP